MLLNTKRGRAIALVLLRDSLLVGIWILFSRSKVGEESELRARYRKLRSEIAAIENHPDFPRKIPVCGVSRRGERGDTFASVPSAALADSLEYLRQEFKGLPSKKLPSCTAHWEAQSLADKILLVEKALLERREPVPNP